MNAALLVLHVILVLINFIFGLTEENTIQEINCYKDIVVSGYKEALNSVYYVTTQARLMVVGNSGSGKRMILHVDIS